MDWIYGDTVAGLGVASCVVSGVAYALGSVEIGGVFLAAGVGLLMLWVWAHENSK